MSYAGFQVFRDLLHILRSICGQLNTSLTVCSSFKVNYVYHNIVSSNNMLLLQQMPYINELTINLDVINRFVITNDLLTN